MNRFLRQTSTYLLGLDPQQRLNLGVAVSAVVIAMVALWTWTSQVPYRVVLGNEDPLRVQEGIRALGAADIPVVQGTDGTVSVPNADFARAWAALATARVYPTMDDIGKLGIGYTSEQLRLGMERQKRGEIAQAIEQMDGVMRAIVFIEEPNRANRLFNPDTGTASVNLVPYPGQSIGEPVVEAVANLVGASVRGINAEHVTVTSNSRVLKSGILDSPEGRELGLDRKRTALEAQLRAKAGEVLAFMGDPTLWSVAAHVELSTESAEVQEQRIDTESPATVRSVTRESESQNSRPGGVPGVDGALPERNEAESGAKEKQTEGNEEVTYDYPVTVVSTHRPAGTVLRQTVSVTLDVAALKARADAESATVEDLQARLSNSLKAATGLDVDRGDRLTLSAFAFAPPMEIPVAEPGAAASIAPWLPYAVQLIAIAMAFVLLRPLVQVIVRPRLASVAHALSEAEKRDFGPVGEADEEQQMDKDDKLAKRLEGMVDGFVTVDSSQLNQLISKESEASAEVIKLWARSG